MQARRLAQRRAEGRAAGLPARRLEAEGVPLRRHLNTLAALLVAAAGLAGPAASYETRAVALRARHLVFDPVSGLLYASVPSSVGPGGNSVRSLDPVTLALGPAVPVGSEPNRLAVSDDGSALYVGLDGSFSIRRLALPRLVPGPEFAVGASPQFRAEEIEVQPGNPDVIAVAQARQASPRYAGIGIYENGVLRPDTAPSHDGANRIEFGSDPGVLFGYGNVSTTGATFYKIAVGPRGASVIDFRGGLVAGSADIEAFGSRVYSTSGKVVDPTTMSRDGQFATGFSDGVVVDAERGRAYFVFPGAVAVFDVERFVPLDVIGVEMHGFPDNLVSFGPGQLAFTTNADEIILFDTTPPDADGDGVPDHLDNCSADANPGQADADQDGLGDACDPHPDEHEGELLACQLAREDAAAERLVCEAEPRFLDADGDGRHDAGDRCPLTPPGVAVDDAGCSLAQFCAGQPPAACSRADWRNDEPRGKPRDCARVGSKQDGFACAPG